MRELLITNDPVLLSYVGSLLADQDIAAVIFDQHMSLMEGSIGAFPRRLLVADDAWPLATRVMQDAGLSEWVKRDDPA
jgi:Putative prokaryotic signal transducing protein